MEELVNKLIELQKTIASMESCTGGAFANEITNVYGSSNVLKYSAVTYSNEGKIKMGISSKTIDKYTVYSTEVANEMSKQISTFTNSDYGVGITGILNDVTKIDPKENIVYVSIYDRENEKYTNMTIEANKKTRKENKEYIINLIVSELKRIIM